MEQPRDIGMPDWLATVVRQQILLADISDVAAVVAFREKMIKWLVFGGLQILRNGFIPFFAIRKHRIDIIDHAAKIKNAVAYDITNGEAGIENVRRVGWQGITGLIWI